jgi:hypothetical protein
MRITHRTNFQNGTFKIADLDSSRTFRSLAAARRYAIPETSSSFPSQDHRRKLEYFARDRQKSCAQSKRTCTAPNALAIVWSSTTQLLFARLKLWDRGNRGVP